ncbi:hypothetical protein ACP70R_012693 [Stipagrostis hirtigluma subsp. patula]
METQARWLLFGAYAIVVMAMGLADAVQGETAPVVVGLAKCSDCTRKNMNAEATFKGLQVAVKCKNSQGEYESTAVGQLDRSGAFSVPLAADLVGDDGELKQECHAELHSASTSSPCPGQEPSMIVAAPHGGKEKTFVALAGKVHHSSPECASAFLCDAFLHAHHPVAIHAPVVVLPKSDHGHAALPPVTVPEHQKPPVTVPEHKPPVAVPEHKPPSTSAYAPTPIYHPPAQRDAVTDQQLFKKLLPFFNKKPFLFKLPFFPPAAQERKH